MIESKSFCDTFQNVKLKTPLLIGMEFMQKPIILNEEREAEFQQILKLYKKQKWCFDLQRIREFLKKPLNAIVITSPAEHIIWVNSGFERMTGYPKNEVLHKSPKFLQGEKTSRETLNELKAAITSQKPFEGILLNYRKDNQEYFCKVDINPVFDINKKLVNFIAFEQEAL